MDKDALAFLEDEPVDEPEVTDEAPAEPEAPQEPEAKAAAPEPERTGEQDPVEPPSTEPEEARSIPVTALLDERDKRQEAQRKAEEADRQIRDLQRQLAELQKPKEEAPDWFENPQEAAQFQARSIEQRFEQQRLAQSRFFAEREFGAETVNEAVAYFDRFPEQSAQFLGQPSPFHAAVEFYKRQQVAEKIGSDPAAYEKQLEDRLREKILAELTQAPQSKPKSPPPSMASAPSAGKETISQGSTFDELFPD